MVPNIKTVHFLHWYLYNKPTILSIIFIYELSKKVIMQLRLILPLAVATIASQTIAIPLPPIDDQASKPSDLRSPPPLAIPALQAPINLYVSSGISTESPNSKSSGPMEPPVSGGSVPVAPIIRNALSDFSPGNLPRMQTVRIPVKRHSSL